MKLKSLTAAVAMALVSGVAAAQVIPLPSTGIIEDDNMEYVVDAQGNIKTSGSLAVGDTLWAVVKFNQILNTDNSTFSTFPGAPSGRELTGLSALTIVDITGGVATFGPNAAFASTYGPGALAALFTQNPGDFTLGCASVATCTTAATNGTPWMTVGLADADDFWIAGGANPFSITTDLSVVAITNGATKVAVANYALSVLTNNTGYTFKDQNSPLSTLLGLGGDGKAQIVGSGDVLGGDGLTNGFIARSDFDFSFSVPLPGTAALLGLGMLGMGWTVRRHAAKAA